ncbi:centrosomal protein 15 isoform X1 [Pseudorasbora parva]|uniref:centrosomal protein 15 isoform X1 n=1 Tax=Pseudorasbora parva TaxID=51549 RepID=UPI00351DEE50
MAFYTHEELELSQKHEDILGKRALLLQQMEAHNEQQKAKKKQQCLMSQAAKERNAQILEVDLQNAETNLQTRQLLHPDIINLETRYWASVERKLPEWEQYLLGKGQPPVSETGRLLRQQRLKTKKQDASAAQCRGKPPRPKPKTAV